ncbi:hypothetical protein R3W88_017997 [Solanum pinnatisectum]|uniref:STML2-like C-terminal extension domain-containing protein n=1 Tax=Solanum pinnatisectum TaxID=50273 RepID=A0AAV9L4E5_9SOLN|nr:hypothetical protein R3W88_017997 [Solanum pinnatisectum]
MNPNTNTNIGRSSSMNKLWLLNHHLHSRTISTTTSSLVTKQTSNQLPSCHLSPSCTSTTVRHFFFRSRDPYAKYHVRVPMNLGIRIVTEKGTMLAFRLMVFSISSSALQLAINSSAKCLRYEIRDITPPRGVRAAMEMQAEAERKKRAQILESEGRASESVILDSEAAKMDQVNRAQGEAEAILSEAQATAKGIALVSQTLKEHGGAEAASLRIAEQYVQAFSNIAKEGTTLLLPTSVSDPASMVAQALHIYKNLTSKNVGIELPEASQTKLKQSDSSEVINNDRSITDEDDKKDH